MHTNPQKVFILYSIKVFKHIYFYILGSASIWVQQHTIYYRPVEEPTTGASSKTIPQSSATASTFNSSRKTNSKNSNPKLMSRRKPEFWVDGTAPKLVSPLTPFLVPKLPDIVTVDDASLDVLALLRVLNALNRYWSCLYFSVPHVHITNQNEFIHSKVSNQFFKSVKVSINNRNILRLLLKLVDNCKTRWL